MNGNFGVQESRHLKSLVKEMAALELLEWVENRCEPVKFYLKLRDENWEWAGAGNIFDGRDFSMERAYDFIQTENLPDLKMFVAHTFDLDDDKGFFAVPRFELTKKNEKFVLKINCWNDENPESFLQEALTPLGGISDVGSATSKPAKSPLERSDVPSLQEWGPYFDNAQDFLKTYPKIVLARVTKATWQNPVNPFALLSSLNQESYRCYLNLPSGKQIVSVSPERLFKIEGHKLITEAVAGTRPRASDPREFLNSPKERAEHQYVVDEILRQIKPLCEKVDYPTTPEVAAFKKVLHLKTPMTATLKNHISVRQLIEALHPTPAVGGLPKVQSVSWLKKNEPFQREFYAAPLGVVSADKAEFFVNIRSVQIDGCELKLYAGVGVVKESRAESEWDEMDLKASQFWDALS